MAITNFDINVQGLETVTATLQGATESAIAQIKQGRFLETLMGENLMLMNSLAAYIDQGGGTSGYTLLDRSNIKFGPKIEAADSWKDTSIGGEIKAIEILTKVDTQIQANFHIDYNDTRYAYPEKAQQLIGEQLKVLSTEALAGVTLELIDVLTGKVSASADGRSYAGITKFGNTTLGQSTTITDALQNYRELGKQVDVFAKKFTETTMGAQRSDFICLVSLETYRELSFALERYTSETIKSIVDNKVIGNKINGLTIIPTPLLSSTHNTTTGFRSDKSYDNSGVQAVVLHKRSLIARYWNFFDLFIDKRQGNFYYTVKANWGVKDGLIRPDFVAYFTTDA